MLSRMSDCRATERDSDRGSYSHVMTLTRAFDDAFFMLATTFDRAPKLARASRHFIPKKGINAMHINVLC